jgi:hypothetical protein
MHQFGRVNLDRENKTSSSAEGQDFHHHLCRQNQLRSATPAKCNVTVCVSSSICAPRKISLPILVRRHQTCVDFRRPLSSTIEEINTMLNIRIKRPCILLLAVFMALFGCATAPQHPSVSVAMLTPYKKIMLARIKTDEMLFVARRSWSGVGGPNLALSLMDDGFRAYTLQTNKAFNDKVKRNMKPEFEALLYTLLDDGLKARQISHISIDIPTKEVESNLYTEEARVRLTAMLRSKCESCDAALLVDPSFGYAGNGNGLRAWSGAGLLLVSLADGTIRAKSSPSFMDTTSKYDYAFESEVIKDATRAANFIPPTVESLAKVILGTVIAAPR